MKKNVLLNFIFSLLFSCGQVIGYNCYKWDDSLLNKPITYLCIIGLTIVLSTSLCLVNILICKQKLKKTTRFKDIFNSKYIFIIFLLLIIIAWIPTLIGLFPGNFSYDAGTQVRMINGTDALTKYHPIIHTLFLGLTVNLGNYIFKSYDIGIFIHSIIQMFIMASISAYTLFYVNKKMDNKILVTIFLFFYMFLPTFSIFSITTTKDIIFSGIFNLVIICLIDMVNDCNILSNKLFITKFIILSFLLIALRNNMLYAYIIFIPFCLIILRKSFKRLFIIFCIIISLFTIYDKSLTYIFKIDHGPRIEMFSFVVQQFGRSYHKGNLNDEQKLMIEKLFLHDSLKNYNSHISDPLKSNFNSGELLNNKKEYLKLYIDLFMSNPKIFADSLLINTYGYYYVLDTMPDYGSRTYVEINCLVTDKNVVLRSNDCPKNIGLIYNFYDDFLEKGKYSNSIVLRLIFNIGTYFWLFVYVLLFLLFNRKLSKSLPLILPFLYLGTLLFSPVAIVRYVYLLYLIVPILIYLLIDVKDA